jgi:4-hydroxybenzoate polyprenyltransferase/phosphoserine phosphatase
MTHDADTGAGFRSGTDDAAANVAAGTRPLCVDLDGTLVATDTLWESVVQLVRRNPLYLLALPLWLLRGRAAFKHAIASRHVLRPEGLPYRSEVLALIHKAREAGRTVILCTAAHRVVAEAIAAHLGLFDDVMASDGKHNLKGDEKRAALVERFGRNGYDYVGDAHVDLGVLADAGGGVLVAASGATLAGAEKLPFVVERLGRRPSMLAAVIKEMRLHQWAKNALVALPVLLADEPATLEMMLQAIAAFFAFGLCASAGYVFNDLVDVEADRAHRTKHTRPFASGALPILAGPPLFVVLLGASFGIGIAFLPPGFLAMLGIYFVTTLTYSFYLKSKLMLDVLVLAGLYTHRILTGGVATDVPISTWLLAFSMFFFMSLAFTKRYVELLDAPLTDGEERVKSRGYTKLDLDMVASMGPASGYIAVLVFSLYLSTDRVQQNYQHPMILWLICPLLLYWISRIWFRAQRRKLHDDPVKFALRDPLSLGFAALIVVIAALAKYLPDTPILDFVH